METLLRRCSERAREPVPDCQVSPTGGIHLYLGASLCPMAHPTPPPLKDECHICGVPLRSSVDDYPNRAHEECVDWQASPYPYQDRAKAGTARGVSRPTVLMH